MTAPASRAGFLWIVRMALRDSRGQRLLMALYAASVVFGIAAIGAIFSLRENLQRIVDEEARSLLGADAVLQTRFAPTTRLTRFIDSLPGTATREIRFRTMAIFPKAEASRFVEVRAIDGPLPFYGAMETDPPNDDAQWPKQGTVFVEQSVLLQLGLNTGDTIRLGDASFRIDAALLRMAGESQITSFFAPRIYLRLDDARQTGLLQTGSLVRYRTHLAVDPPDLPDLRAQLQQGMGGLLADQNVRVETVEDRRENLRALFQNLLDFLNLSGFIALVLGAVGMMGSVRVFLNSKRESIAILRCLGVRTSQTFAIYFVQVQLFGLLGAVAGSLLGALLPFLVPLIVGPLLLQSIEIQFSFTALLIGLFFGWFITTTTSLIPLLALRSISPLSAIRASVQTSASAWRDPLAWLIMTVLIAGMLAFFLIPARQPLIALQLSAGVGVAFLILSALAVGLRATLRRLTPASAPYSVRVAFGNLYRPGNRTLLLMVTLGMGTFLIQSFLLTRIALSKQTDLGFQDQAPSVFLIDVQPDQRDALMTWLDKEGFSAADPLPVVTMRVTAIKDKPLRHWRTLPDSPVEDWVYSWEFRNTYRDHLLDNATLLEGEFIPRYEGPEPFPVSLSQNILDDFGVGIGDTITWNVQGLRIRTVVSSIRDVSWKAGRNNFNFVFPLGTIGNAPTQFAVPVRTNDRAHTARLQSEIAASFPNVSAVDLSLVFDALNDVLSRAAFVIRFMALFTLVTGLIVLAASILGSRYQRLRESILFRTLGASAAFIRRVLLLEFVLLGFLGTSAGLLLGYAGAAALLHFVFELPLPVAPFESAALLLTITALTLLTGWLTSRGIAQHPPIAILRKQ